MRILSALLLSLGSIFFGPVNAAEIRNFQGVIVAVNGLIAEVDDGTSYAPLYVRAPNALSKTIVGKSTSGVCVIRGDLCIATVFNIEE